MSGKCDFLIVNVNYYVIPLFVLFSGNETEAVRLLEEGADASVPGPYGRLPMYWAAKRGKKNAFVIFF